MEDQQAILNRYQVIPRSLVFLFYKNEVLLIRKKQKNKFGCEKWNGIGGHIERGENPIEAARREILEESGISVKNLEFDYNVLLETNNRMGICLFVFHGNVKSKKYIKSNEGDLLWIDIDKLGQLELVMDVIRLIELIRSKPKKQKSFFLKYHYDQNNKLRIEVL